MATELGCARSTLYHVVSTGIRKPGRKLAGAMHRKLGVEPSEWE